MTTQLVEYFISVIKSNIKCFMAFGNSKIIIDHLHIFGRRCHAVVFNHKHSNGNIYKQKTKKITTHFHTTFTVNQNIITITLINNFLREKILWPLLKRPFNFDIRTLGSQWRISSMNIESIGENGHYINICIRHTRHFLTYYKDYHCICKLLQNTKQKKNVLGNDFSVPFAEFKVDTGSFWIFLETIIN